MKSAFATLGELGSSYSVDFLLKQVDYSYDNESVKTFDGFGQKLLYSPLARHEQ